MLALRFKMSSWQSIVLFAMFIGKLGFKGGKETKKQFGQMKLPNTHNTWNSNTFHTMI